MQLNYKKLRELRLKKGLTQEEVARAIGYESNLGYHYIETGKRRITAERLARLAELFGVGIEDLFTKEEVAQCHTNHRS